MEGIQSFQRQIYTMERNLEQGSIYWSLPALIVKYQHNIDIYHRCIVRLTKRYFNVFGEVEIMMRKYDIESMKWAYNVIVDDYKPTTKVILKELDRIDNPKDKIKYLKDEEAKYLLEMTMNIELILAYSYVTDRNPHKAGLDGWIQLHIDEINRLSEND
jgi:hypothetical protein